MHAVAVPLTRPASTALVIDERERDTPGVAIPHPEVHVVVRFGPTTRSGLDIHAMGLRQSVLRKTVRRGQRTVMARLPLGAHEAVLGVPASELTGRVVALEELWGEVAVRRLSDQLAEASSLYDAAAILEHTISQRSASKSEYHARARLAVEASTRLAASQITVTEVAADLGVSERHLRRVFRDTVGVGPKAFAQLARFDRALSAARSGDRESWASIAAAAGYYDQAHLIAEFRSIAGSTPQALLGELRRSLSLG